MAQVYIGLGSNLANPSLQLRSALKAMANLPNTCLLSTSSFYGSAPQGPQDQPDFINAVCLLDTPLLPNELLKALQAIEQTQGRTKKRHWGERLIDLDILLYDDQVINAIDLTVPHPQLLLRDFVLQPLAEIAPGLVITQYQLRPFEPPHAQLMQTVEAWLEQLGCAYLK
ncbi:2-amino-4-hydroxy-6-hydroxymethyldihydropteridine diphosphokinase [Thiomicrorhabdus aquaedulcis]|uniref:2-amino-4-hydroxy-6- hydroxymethyldihydropteridine diphosphokinase n=1 Tax=Thiomicrorhabdus aquaedulcis TaxID=2211106 RepID=UPI000FDB9D4F|nr:2-amino-4-hydroxy-6-hydroxymethyldihydropteridine diphosphokinase [Thiomicrorhabdus aquaedulcis]